MPYKGRRVRICFLIAYDARDERRKLTWRLRYEDDDEPWWIVFFAPSAAAHVMPALRGHFSMGVGESSPASKRRARLAAIGPTTAKSIREDAGFEVDAVADEPNADSLVLSLLGAK